MSLREKGAVTGVGETALYARHRSHAAVAATGGLAERDRRCRAEARPTSTASSRTASARWPRTSSPISAFRTCGFPPPRRWAAPAAVAAIQCAIAAIDAGICNHVLLSLGRTGYSGGRIGTRVQQMPQFRVIGEFEMPSGAIAPAQLYAAMARRHMELYGTTVAAASPRSRSARGSTRSLQRRTRR